jgi:hypothetical protein
VNATGPKISHDRQSGRFWEHRRAAGRRQCIANDTMELNAMSSPEELTFVVGRWLRPIVFVLDVVRRFNTRTTSSREHRRTTSNQ